MTRGVKKLLLCAHCGMVLSQRWDGALMHEFTGWVRCKQGYYVLSTQATMELDYAAPR